MLFYHKNRAIMKCMNIEMQGGTGMGKRVGRWLIVFMAGLCFYSFNMPVNAGNVKENTAYRIIDKNSRKPIEVIDGSFKNGAEIQLGDRKEGNKSQMFFLEKVDGGTLIKAAHSLKVVGVRKSSFKDMAIVWQWENEDLSSMKWKVIENGDGTVSFENRNSEKMLDVAGGKKSKGTQLQQYAADGSDAQKFELEEVPAEEMCDANKDTSDIIIPTSGRFYRIVNAASKKVWDVRDMSDENGTLLQLWFKKKGNENQMFRFTSQGDGYYSIIAMHSEKAIEVGGSSLEAGATVNQWKHIKDYPPQMWKLLALEGDKFILCNNNSGMVADVKDGKLTNGQEITQYDFNGTDAQIFYLEEVSKKEYE